MPAVTEIKKLKDGYIIYTSKILLTHEQEIIKEELKKISAERLGHLFFRVA